ncbi:hypothetical protein [Streptomyces melanogenes]|uniref:hypothetical protein n=1 Tax=Streptomyces melanogenes TaxID=67326 RepID=UPI0037ABA860
MIRTTDWEQPADRHSELVDPVITVRQLSRFEFARRSLTRIDHALVFSTPKGSYDTYLPPVRPTRAEAAAKRYTAVYEVDMGVHPVQAEFKLPSDNDAFEFGVVLDLSWQVAEPGRFVASGHRNVPRLLLGELEETARPVARRFAIADSAAAEQTILAAVTASGPLGSHAGLNVTWTVRLRRDQENIDHQLRLQAIHHDTTEQILAQQRGMEFDVELDRRQRQQDALTVARQREYGLQEQDLVLQQQRWQHERAVLETQQQVELQRLKAEKIAFYQAQLEQGGIRAWALHLAEHPEDAVLAINSMREDQLRLLEVQKDLVGQVLGGDTAESYELEGPKQLAFKRFSEILNQRLLGHSEPGWGEAPASVTHQVQLLGPASQDTPPTTPQPPAAEQPARPPKPSTPPAQPIQHATFAGWQPPPGYGSTPTMPTADAPTTAEPEPAREAPDSPGVENAPPENGAP